MRDDYHKSCEKKLSFSTTIYLAGSNELGHYIIFDQVFRVWSLNKWILKTKRRIYNNN